MIKKSMISNVIYSNKNNSYYFYIMPQDGAIYFTSKRYNFATKSHFLNYKKIHKICNIKTNSNVSKLCNKQTNIDQFSKTIAKSPFYNICDYHEKMILLLC